MGPAQGGHHISLTAAGQALGKPGARAARRARRLDPDDRQHKLKAAHPVAVVSDKPSSAGPKRRR